MVLFVWLGTNTKCTAFMSIYMQFTMYPYLTVLYIYPSTAVATHHNIAHAFEHIVTADNTHFG